MPEDMNIEQAELHGANGPSVSVFSRFRPETQEYLREHFKEGTLKGHLSSLRGAGFTNPVASIEKHPPLASYDIRRVIGDLRTAGFTNPVASIEKFPPLAGLDIRRVIGDLRTAGFTNPVASIEKFPPLAGYDIQRVVGDLRTAGFTNPVASIEKHPQLAGHDIQRVVGDLKTAGFTNPVASIEKFPPLAGLDTRRVIGDLKTAGFTNPVASIEKFPPLAGLDIRRVKRRLRLIQRLNRRFNLHYDPIGVVEAFSQYLSYSKDRLFFFLRIGSYYNIPENVYRGLISLNPFLVFSELLAQPEGLEGIPGRIRKLSKSDKDQKISEVKEKLADIENTLESYTPHQKTFFLRLARNLKRQNESGKKKTTKA